MGKNRSARPQTQNAAAAALQTHFARGMALHQQGKLADAERIYEEILRRQPSHFDALHLLGVIAVQRRQTRRGVELIAKAVGLNANVAAAHNNLGAALQDLGRLEEALASHEKAITLKPDFAEAYNNHGNALRHLNRPADALASYQKAVALKPDYAQAYNNHGNALRDLKRSEHALTSYDKAITSKPDFAEAHNNRGNALLELGRPEEALASYDNAIALKPDFAEAYNARSMALQDLDHPAEAMASCDKAIALKPGYAEAYDNRGIALLDLKRAEAALASHDRAIALKPDCAEAHNNRGNALLELKRPEEALASYDKALALRADYARAFNNRGNALLELKRPEEALANYDQALALKSEFAEAHNNRGNALLELKRPEEALASYDQAVALKPAYAEAYNNRGNAMRELKRLDEAIANYDKALLLKADFPGAEGVRLYTKLQCCDWSDYDLECAHLISSVRNGTINTSPLAFLAIPSSSKERLRCAELWAAHNYPPCEKPNSQRQRSAHNRIRIAYLSADFRQHPVAYSVAGIFECHDRSRFDVTAISFGPDDGSDLRRRVAGAFERFVDARTYSDSQIADLVRKLEIDIMIDLTGFTEGSRTGVFARRAAPIQVSYLGYLGTMGAVYIDYIIADRTVIPDDQRDFYSEKIVYMPDSFWPADRARRISDRIFTRQECGLPPDGFVFCCFNSNYKLTPDIYDIWMRVLQRVDGSVLWLATAGSTAARNLRSEAARRGVDPERVVLAPLMPLPEHQARLRLADLFLDTLPYNAGATAVDTLWAGVPVLTRIGDTFAGRIAASAIKAVELPELITTTPEAYEALAVEYATRPNKLDEIKQELAHKRLTAPLFDTRRLTKHIEAAYTAMYERYLADAVLADIHVANS